MLKETIHTIEIVNMFVSFAGSIIIILTSHKETVKKEDAEEEKD